MYTIKTSTKKTHDKTAQVRDTSVRSTFIGASPRPFLTASLLFPLLTVCLLLAAFPAVLHAQGDDSQVHNPAMPYKITYSTALSTLFQGETFTVEATTPPDASTFAPVANGGYVYSNGETNPETDPDCPKVATVRLTLTNPVDGLTYTPSVTYLPGGNTEQPTTVTPTLVDPAPSATSLQWTFPMPAGPVTVQWEEVVIPEEGQSVSITDTNNDIRQIGGEEPVSIPGLTVGASPENTVTLSNVSIIWEANISSLQVQRNVTVTFNLQGENRFGITNLGTLTLTADPSVSQESIIEQVVNYGHLIDETGCIESVGGTAALTIEKHPEEHPSGTPADGVILFTEVSVDELSSTLTAIWQKLVGKVWVNLDASGRVPAEQASAVLASASPALSGSETANANKRTFSQRVYEDGIYRCQVTNTVSSSPDSESGSVTVLSTHTAEVTLTEPEPTPAFYTITLPSINGATLDPSPAVYTVDEGSSFTFTLTLDPAYNQSVPVVTVGAGESDAVTLNGETLADGSLRYTVPEIWRDVVVSVDGIEPNPGDPTGVAGVEGSEVRVWCADGQLHVYTPVSARVEVYSYGGSLVDSRRVPGGDTMIQAPSGPCIVKVDDLVFKIAR